MKLNCSKRVEGEETSTVLPFFYKKYYNTIIMVLFCNFFKEKESNI